MPFSLRFSLPARAASRCVVFSVLLIASLTAGCDAVDGGDGADYEAALVGTYRFEAAEATAVAVPAAPATFLGSGGQASGVTADGLDRPFQYVRVGRTETGSDDFMDVGHEITLRTHFDASDGADAPDAPRCILALVDWERVYGGAEAPPVQPDELSLNCSVGAVGFASYWARDGASFTYDRDRVELTLPRTQVTLTGEGVPGLPDVMHVEGSFKGIVVSASAGTPARIPMPLVTGSRSGPRVFSRGTLRADGSYETVYRFSSIGDGTSTVVETGAWSADRSVLTFVVEAVDGVAIDAPEADRVQRYDYALDGSRLRLEAVVDACRGAADRELCLIGASEQLSLGEPAPLTSLDFEVVLEMVRE